MKKVVRLCIMAKETIDHLFLDKKERRAPSPGFNFGIRRSYSEQKGCRIAATQNVILLGLDISTFSIFGKLEETIVY